MGNRAIITVATTKTAPAIYLHWNGGPESVLAFLECAKQLGVRDPASDPDYFMGRLAQIIGNFFGDTLSLGVGRADQMDDGDNGRYIVGKDFKIIKACTQHPWYVDALNEDERDHYEGVLKTALEINRPIFNRRA